MYFNSFFVKDVFGLFESKCGDLMFVLSFFSVTFKFLAMFFSDVLFRLKEDL